MSALLGFAGSAASGYAQGRQQRDMAQAASREAAIKEMLAGLEQQKFQRDTEPAPDEFLGGLEGIYPDARKMQGFTRGEALRGADIYSALRAVGGSLSFDERMALAEKHNQGAINAKRTPPGQNPPTREEQIKWYTDMLAEVSGKPENEMQFFLSKNPKFAGMGADKAAIIARLKETLKSLGVADNGALPAPSQPSPAPAPAPAPGAPAQTMPAPQPSSSVSVEVGKQLMIKYKKGMQLNPQEKAQLNAYRASVGLQPVP